MIWLCDLCVLCGEKFKEKEDFYNFLYNKKPKRMQMKGEKRCLVS
jgi:hypothetical protein